MTAAGAAANARTAEITAFRWSSTTTYQSPAGEGSLYLSDTRFAKDTVADYHGGDQFVAAVVIPHERGRLWVFVHVYQPVGRAGEP